ncbi:hypothetical protein OH77DRAFT_1214273 [Trametes cingulata]|nr:hypothetical protein OH77DRAFT_1214273 [Trametes cingulata]
MSASSASSSISSRDPLLISSLVQLHESWQRERRPTRSSSQQTSPPFGMHPLLGFSTRITTSVNAPTSFKAHGRSAKQRAGTSPEFMHLDAVSGNVDEEMSDGMFAGHDDDLAVTPDTLATACVSTVLSPPESQIPVDVGSDDELLGINEQDDFEEVWEERRAPLVAALPTAPTERANSLLIASASPVQPSLSTPNDPTPPPFASPHPPRGMATSSTAAAVPMRTEVTYLPDVAVAGGTNYALLYTESQLRVTDKRASQKASKRASGSTKGAEPVAGPSTKQHGEAAASGVGSKGVKRKQQGVLKTAEEPPAKLTIRIRPLRGAGMTAADGTGAGAGNE